MTLHRRRLLFALAGLGAAGAFAQSPAAAGSVYALDAKLTDQDGRTFDFASLRGKPVLVSMFYTSCTMVCPMIFESIHATLAALPPAERTEVHVLMVSFDPARDTVAVLKDTAEKRGADARWTLARADEGTTRKMAAVLGVQYRKLPDGEFNHSTQVALLDREGRIVARSGKLGGADAALVKRVRGLAAG